MSTKDCAESDTSSDTQGDEALEKDYEFFDPVLNWDVDHVCNWVDSIGFPLECEYAQKFRQGAVHGPLLLKLDSELLEDIGVTRKVHVLRFLTDIEALKKTSNEKEKKSRGKSPKTITVARRDQNVELTPKIQRKFDHFKQSRTTFEIHAATTEPIRDDALLEPSKDGGKARIGRYRKHKSPL